MADPTGFLKVKRKEAGNRPVHERICDFSEIEQTLNSDDRMLQASRCMDCGTPFCHWACPLDNLIPEWNDLLWKGDWKKASDRLHATNNFPEFTGRICPAPCEHACVLNIGEEPVTIRENEVAITERAFSEGYIKPKPPRKRTGKKIAVVGSGPAGMAAADLLNKWGHNVTLFEKNRKAGGLLRYGIPDFKLSKATIDRRLKLMTFEGLEIRAGTEIGKDIPGKVILGLYDAVCLTIGSMKPRDLNIDGRELEGIYFAMDFLTQQNMINDGEIIPQSERICAEGLRVVVLGGGDTGSDCVGTAIRQKAASVTQIEILPQPPIERTPNNPWPFYAKTLKNSTSHEEGCERLWSISTTRFTEENGQLTGLEVENVLWESSDLKKIMKPIPETHRIIPADMVILALGFVHPVLEGLVNELGLELDHHNNIKTSSTYQTSLPGVFAAGDAVSGASLVVNAIASGRKAAVEIDRYLREKSDK
ncbi:MAG: glutamate synthase subunit beta [Bacteroidales bacterium]